MINNRLRSSFKNSDEFWLVSDQLLTSVAAFVVTVIIARALELPAFGWFSCVILCQLFVLAIQHAFISGPYQVLISGTTDKERNGYRNAVFGMEGLFLVFLLIICIALYLFSPQVLSFLQPDWWWIVLSTGGFLLQEHLRRFFTQEGSFFEAFIIGAISSLLQVVILAIFYYHAALSFSVCFQIIGISYLPSLCIGVYWLKLGTTKRLSFLKSIRLHLQTAKWLIMTAVLQWLSGNFFILSAGLILGAAAFAALRLAQSLFGFINVLLQIFENHVVPDASDLYKTSSHELRKYIRHISLKAALIVIPVLAVIIVFAQPVFTLLGGAQYAPYSIVIQGMALLQMPTFLGYPVRIAIRVLLLNKAFFIGYVITFVFSFLSARLFIHIGEVEGVLWGLIINQLLILSYWQAVLQRRKFILWK